MSNPQRSTDLRIGIKIRSISIAPIRRSALLACWFLLLIGAPALAQTSMGQTNEVRFRAVDVYVDSKQQSLAAYQLELLVVSGNAKIVGIEGGEAGAFNHPPFYDPKAMQQDRVIIAAFSTNALDALPKGKTRVATIHLRIDSGAESKFELKLHAAADANGTRIAAEPDLKPR